GLHGARERLHHAAQAVVAGELDPAGHVADAEHGHGLLVAVGVVGHADRDGGVAAAPEALIPGLHVRLGTEEVGLVAVGVELRAEPRLDSAARARAAAGD